MKFTNETMQRIYDVIMDDINRNESNGSSITTNQVWKLVGTHISMNSVRDKIQYLVSNKYFTARYEFWDNNKYYNRKLYPVPKQECVNK